jgi:hypothetical protein
MKKNSGLFFGLPCWKVGTVLLVFCAFTTVSRADVVVDNTGTSAFSYSGLPLAQVFTMSGTSGNLSSLTLELNVLTAGSAEVDLYSVTAGHVPNSLIASLGTVSGGTFGDGQLIAVSSLFNQALTANTEYAIVLQPSSPGVVEWDNISSAASGGTGALGLAYFNSSGWSTVPDGNYFQMNLQTTPVPEVPITGVVMGFGALAIALVHTLRCKLHPAFHSSIA